MQKSELQYLEEWLLTIDARKSRAELDKLIADDFKEFSSSGRVWSKTSILDELPLQQPIGSAVISNFEELELVDGYVLVTYQLDLAGTISLRSSVWRKTHDGWRIFFHQGTTRNE